jgi:hypothetical protein
MGSVWNSLLQVGSLWDGFFGGIIGSVVGSSLAILHERRQRRCEIAIGLIEQFNSNYVDIGNALELMERDSATDWNRVRKIGDWYETCAALCVEKMAKGSLLRKVGIDREMKRFYESASRVQGLSDAVKLWCHMREFCIKS